MSLRLQVMVLVAVLVAISVAAISGILIARFQTDMQREMTGWSEVIRADLIDRGKAVATNAAMSASEAIDSRDFLFLAALVKTATTQDPDIEYGFLADKNGRILVHSTPQETGKILKVEEYKEAVTSGSAQPRDTVVEGKPTIEVVAPITVGNFLWGTMHFGLSLAKLDQAQQQSRAVISTRMKQGITATAIGGGVVLVLGALLGAFAATRISAPLKRLSEDIDRIRSGDRQHLVRAGGCREFALFGMGINELTNQNQQSEQSLKKNIETLGSALDEAQNASRSRDQFLANVSHELSTPLNAILTVPRSLLDDYRMMKVWHCGNCGSVFEVEGKASGAQQCPDCHIPLKLEDRHIFTGDPNEHFHFMGRVRQATNHMKRIIQAFVDYSKLKGARMVARREQVRVADLVADVRDIIGPLAEEKKVKLELPNIDPSIVIDADRTMLSQILVNLVGNAVKFTPASGTATLEIGGRNGMLSFRVRDTGVGIPREELDNIFRAFYQVDGSHTRAFGGTGLGLAIAREMVELHQGRVWAESEGRGKGSVFTFEFPGTAAKAARAS
ncbi:MAG: ATP-binding protein [Myxococcota bacterium]|nr:ATP-binding protein [Myxococcota bacterium]